jgi:hypothetical protein
MATAKTPQPLIFEKRMLTNSDITIYNKYRVASVDTYQRTTVVDVAWEQRHARSKQDSDDLATVFIPMLSARNYLKPKEWQALSNKSGRWTLQVGDVIVKGLVDDELTAIFTLTNLKNAYDDVLVVSSVDTRDYGSPSMQHFQVGAK